MKALILTLTTLAAVVLLAKGDNPKPCKFPSKMEGKIQLFKDRQLVFSPYARLTVDYDDKKVAIIRHPTNDEIFIRQNLGTGYMYTKNDDGICTKSLMRYDENLYRGVPNDAKPAPFDITGLGKTANKWIFQDHHSTTYMAVLKADCLPSVIHRNFGAKSRAWTELYFEMKTSINDTSVLGKTCAETHLG